MSLLVMALLMTAAAGVLFGQQAATPPKAPPRPIMEITGPDFADGAAIPPKYTCLAPNGAAVSPLLRWSDASPETASFVVIFHDSELHPRKGIDDILHWMMWNIPADVHELSEAVPVAPELPNGARQGKAGGKNGYMAPCAPVGKAHHYVFNVYALDQKVDLPPEATREELRKAMDGHVLGEAVYVGRFHR